MSVYLLLTLVGVTAKLWALTELRKHWHATPLHQGLLWLIITLLLQSIFELSLYLLSDRPGSAGAYWSMVGYYVFIFIAIVLLPFIARLATEKPITAYFTVIAISIAAAVILLLLFTRVIIADINSLHAALTAVPGSHYWIFQVAALTAVLYSASALISGSRLDDYYIKTRSQNLLLAFIPTGLFAFFVVFAMHMGFQINAVGVLPICVLIYVAALVMNADPEQIIDYTYLIPLSRRWKLLRKIKQRVCSVRRDGAKPDKNEYEQLLVQYTLEIFNGNQTQTAKYLNMHQSWVSRLARKAKPKA